MKFKIGHFYGKEPPVPEAVLLDVESGGGDHFVPVYEIDLKMFDGLAADLDRLPSDNTEGLLAFVEKYGNIILSPPNKTPFKGEWFIWVTDETGRFRTK